VLAVVLLLEVATARKPDLTRARLCSESSRERNIKSCSESVSSVDLSSVNSVQTLKYDDQSWMLV
jgi:hypothetical protein